LLAGRDLRDLFAKDGLIGELKKALSQRMLAVELEDHLKTEAEAGRIKRGNGSLKKTMLTGLSKVRLDIAARAFWHV
jgi:putative transposase